MAKHVHVVGSGPVAFVTALRLASSRRITLHLSHEASQVARTRSVSAMPVRSTRHSVEVIPAATLALLVELGVHPFDIGAHKLHRSKSIAWNTNDWIQVDTTASAHIDRPRLDSALLTLVRSHPDIEMRLANAESLSELGSSRVGLLFDATGRRSRLARSKLAVANAPVGRTWTRPLSTHEAARPGLDHFQIAALAQGYVYRLRSASTELVGWCGSPKLLSNGVDDWARILSDAGLIWPQLVDATTSAPTGWRLGKAGHAGPQRCEASHGVVLVGDAAFARDVLCSQGLATGLSDAMYVADVDLESKLAALNEHRLKHYAKHLESLVTLIQACRFRDSTFWKAYARSLKDEHAVCATVSSNRTVHLQRGRIQIEANIV